MSGPVSKNQTRHRNAFKAGVNKAAAAIMSTLKGAVKDEGFLSTRTIERLTGDAIAPLLEDAQAQKRIEVQEGRADG